MDRIQQWYDEAHRERLIARLLAAREEAREAVITAAIYAFGGGVVTGFGIAAVIFL